VLFYLMVSLLEALGSNVEPGYPGEHGSTAFVLEGWTIPLCRTFWAYVDAREGRATKIFRRGYTLRSMSDEIPLALMVQTPDEPGVLHALTRVFLDHEANITHIDIAERREGLSTVYFELEDVAGEAADVLIGDLKELPVVRAAERAPSFQKVYGKRIIVVGGGAQVGQVVVGAVAEADRHNIRGEKISVDTIPLVGEEELAAATRAVARLPRAVALVLAGALMGGEVTRAVHEIREKGIIVLSLNMPGSVPDAADLVVSDPVQCGVMAVMAVSDSALFDITRQREIGRAHV
jgi:energy-converting hydrogenase B subunit Q